MKYLTRRDHYWGRFSLHGILDDAGNPNLETWALLRKTKTQYNDMFLKWRGFGSRRCAIPGSQIEVHVVTKFSVVLGGNIHTRFSSSLVFDMFLSYFVTIPTSKVKGIETSRCLATLEYVK